MDSNSYIGSPLIDPVLTQVVNCAEHCINSVILGARGIGISTVAGRLQKELFNRNLHSVLLDCRAPSTWQESLRKISGDLAAREGLNGKKIVLIVDHAGDLPAEEILAIRTTTSEWKISTGPALQQLSAATKKPRGSLGILLRAARRFSATKLQIKGNDHIGFSSEVWVGNLNCRGLEDQYHLALAAEPRLVFQIPEYNTEQLISLYSSIGQRQDSEWGEAILFTILDWCGPDLALAESLGAHFYGIWRDNIYDETVADTIGRWLKTDQLVDEYRRYIQSLDEPGKALINLLNTGGKVPSHSPLCNQEPNESIRRLYLSGIVSPNLLPGFYQYRNLTMRLLAFQAEPDVPPLENLDMFRKYSNRRIGDVLQDAELSLRLLALCCFTRMGYDAVREKLKAIRTDELALPTDFRKSLLEWAKVNGGPNQQESLGRYLTQYQKDFNARHNLWSRIREMYATEMHIELADNVELPFAKMVSFMTFSELSNLIQSLGSTAFPRWDGTDFSREPPGRRWPAYLALLGRLRNQTAHLRNVAFQDMEDLFTIVREMRKDIDRYA